MWDNEDISILSVEHVYGSYSCLCDLWCIYIMSIFSVCMQMCLCFSRRVFVCVRERERERERKRER